MRVLIAGHLQANLKPRYHTYKSIYSKWKESQQEFGKIILKIALVKIGRI